MLRSIDKVLLPMHSLSFHGLKAEEASLSSVIRFLNLNPSQRSQRHITILQILTADNAFFREKIQELGKPMHSEACEKMTYEFVPASTVFPK